MIKLEGYVQNYSWGKRGTSSAVALLVAASSKRFEVKEDRPYAELWMGTHEKGPSKIASTTELLHVWLAQNTTALGDAKYNTFGTGSTQGLSLPFLFKVLSVNEALSIQIHPTKEQAIKLHAQDPKNYPDNNHKPEMAIALTEFEILCSFRPADEILRNIEDTPELNRLISRESLKSFQDAHHSNIDPTCQDLIQALKKCFSDLMRQNSEVVQKSVKELFDRYVKLDSSDTQCQLFLRISKAFPGDVGCFSVFFLNHIILEPGEAVFLPPNEPHAYLYGDCIECMACSDNTIRAGLTPKFKDVDNLLEMLTYLPKQINEVVFNPVVVDCNLTVYTPPVPEFVVHKIELQDEIWYHLEPLPVCSIIICVNGSAAFKYVDPSQTDFDVSKGCIFLIPAHHRFTVDVKQYPLLLFRAFCDQIK